MKFVKYLRFRLEKRVQIQHLIKFVNTIFVGSVLSRFQNLTRGQNGWIVFKISRLRMRVEIAQVFVFSFLMIIWRHYTRLSAVFARQMTTISLFNTVFQQ